MCSNYPGIKLEPALKRLIDKIEHLSSYAQVVHTTAKQVILSWGKNENIFKMSKNENDLDSIGTVESPEQWNYSSAVQRNVKTTFTSQRQNQNP